MKYEIWKSKGQGFEALHHLYVSYSLIVIMLYFHIHYKDFCTSMSYDQIQNTSVVRQWVFIKIYQKFDTNMLIIKSLSKKSKLNKHKAKQVKKTLFTAPMWKKTLIYSIDE